MSIPGLAIDTIAGGANQLGSFFIDTTAVTFGKFQYLVVNVDCVFTVLTTNTGRDLLLDHGEGGDFGDGLNLAGQTVGKGLVIYPIGRETIKNVTLSIGSVLAYG